MSIELHPLTRTSIKSLRSKLRLSEKELLSVAVDHLMRSEDVDLLAAQSRWSTLKNTYKRVERDRV